LTHLEVFSIIKTIYYQNLKIATVV